MNSETVRTCKCGYWTCPKQKEARPCEEQEVIDDGFDDKAEREIERFNAEYRKLF